MPSRDDSRHIHTLAAGIVFFDLHFHGHSRVIASAVLHEAGSVAIVDPGPTSTLPALRASLDALGFTIADITALLLTHIHIDHAGVAGTLLRENPNIQVFVHEKGAPHLIDPSKLLASAERLWPGQMDRLWGEVAPVPAAAIEVLTGGERLRLGGRVLDVAYTPGHASHHVSFFNDETGIAFVGDTAGVQMFPHGAVVPPTPPPDIDFGLWRDSLTRIARWNPETLFITHFGPVSPALLHMQELRDGFERMEALFAEALAQASDEAGRQEWFVEAMRRDLRRDLNEADAAKYEAASPFDLSWKGLARYFSKKNA